MHKIEGKADYLFAHLNHALPAVQACLRHPQPATALLRLFTAQPRPQFRFDYTRKAEICAFLHQHYAAWRTDDTSLADDLVATLTAEGLCQQVVMGVRELGLAWWKTGNPRYGIAFNQVFDGTSTAAIFNWGYFSGRQASLELDAFYLLLDCDAFTEGGRLGFLAHLYAILTTGWDRHVAQFSPLTLGPEGHNWYVHGVCGMPWLGILFPEFDRADELLHSGWSVVEEHLRGHYLPDGGARETIFGYQWDSLLHLWDLYLLASRNHFPTSPAFLERMMRATRILFEVMTPRGTLPSFGDKWLTPVMLTRLAAIAATLTGDRECKWYAEYARRFVADGALETPGEIPRCAFWDVGLAGAHAYADIAPLQPGKCSFLLGDMGYAVLRTTHAPEAAYLAMAAAPRGPIVTSHGHNDIFSLEVHAHGAQFLGELGCAPYGETPGRWYDQTTAAHNCLTVDGEEQVPLLTEWRWDGNVYPKIRRWISQDTHDFVHGVHEGYYRYPDQQTIHARKIFFVKSAPAYWVVMDWVESNLDREYRVYFHGCLPGACEGNTFVIGDRDIAHLAVIPPAGDELTVAQVQEAGWQAYCQERAIDPHVYPCVAYTTRARKTCLVWVLSPLQPGQTMPKVSRLPALANGVAQLPDDVTTIQVTFPEVTDRLCIAHRDFDARLSVNDETSWGFLSFVRRNALHEPVLTITHTVADGVCGR